MASSLATLITSKNSSINTFPDPLEIGVGREITIGRSSSCDLVFPEVRALSHVHCHVRNSGSGVEIKCVSSNVTLVDGKPISKDQWVRLYDGACILLSKQPKVKLSLKIGEVDKLADKKRRTEVKKRTNAIAEITSASRDFPVKFFVSPLDHASRDEKIAVTIGRSKDCDIRLSHSKVSSAHCKLIFSRIEGESVHWSLEVESMSRNKTYVGAESVDEGSPIRIESFTDPVLIHLVFPPHKNPVETITVTPLIIASVPESTETTPEEKRQKKEVRAFEKQSDQWQRTYNQEVRNLIELENRLMSEIDSIEFAIVSKRADICKAQNEIDTMENNMTRKDQDFQSVMTKLKIDHGLKLTELTTAVNVVMTRLSQRTDEKLKLQLPTAKDEPNDRDD